MRAEKLIFSVIFVFFLVWSGRVQAYSTGYLTASQIERVKAAKALLEEVDTKSLSQTIRELERSPHPMTNLEIKEAEAKAYTDIVKEEEVQGQKKKEWLYSMVCLNMAYLQFGGGPGTSRDTTDLNRLIRQKLKKYLPPGLLQQEAVSHSLE